MQKNLIAVIQDGHDYIKQWPMQKELFALFPECRVIKATQFAFIVMPVVALLSLVLQLQALGSQYFPQALAFALLIISLPVQGYIWLGKRSQETLPINLQSWYKELETKLAVEGIEVRSSVTKPRYIEMAKLLNKAFSKLDKAFTKDLF
ncbi:DUF412 domain-containing protein [Catenovulum sp. SM1970]|uniref:terminus macrodomain insulation protein YfbV n=1 Tax=Marinifaba aquimaris TaxID=2741323 RepID=UPI001571C8C1|nr:terminus macrodomain insulation protein YfbV [Marinifaba aquimaris]NTS78536.1 DUF412 domain-containing protein [Marinifaba aquimaris]